MKRKLTKPYMSGRIQFWLNQRSQWPDCEMVQQVSQYIIDKYTRLLNPAKSRRKAKKGKV